MREPLYRASSDELSPRADVGVRDARKRILPAIIQKEYADAKTAFDKTGFRDRLRRVRRSPEEHRGS